MGLFPQSIEKYVAADHPVRAYDAFVEASDFRHPMATQPQMGEGRGEGEEWKNPVISFIPLSFIP